MGGKIHKFGFMLDDRIFSSTKDLLAITNFAPPQLRYLHYQRYIWEASQAAFDEPFSPETGGSAALRHLCS